MSRQDQSTEPFPAPGRKDGEAPCGECRLKPGETCDICGAIGARQGIEAQMGLNDTFPGDPYPACGKIKRL